MKRVQLYALFYSYFFLLFTIKPIQAQGDPLQWTEPVSVEANDLFLLWLEDVGPSVKSYQKVYRYKIDSTWLPLNQLISEIPRQEDSRPANNTNYKFCDVASGRFNVDAYDDLVALWTGQGSSINIIIPQFDTTDAMWTTSVQASIENVNPYNRIYVRTGDFDADSLDEFVVARVNQNNEIRFHIYDVDSTLQPSLITTFSDEYVSTYWSEWLVNYFIQTGDFNGDGRDEIVINTVFDQSNYNSKVHVYEADDDLNLHYKVGETVYGGSQDWYSHNFLKVADINLDNKKEIVIIKNWIDWQPCGFSAQFFSYNSNLDELVEIGRLRGDEGQNNVGHPFAVALGNFDVCNFTIGQPTHSSVYDIVQPIVILNALPVHFDMFGTNIFDINNCYNGGNCDFVSTYKKLNTTSIEVSTKVHKD